MKLSLQTVAQILNDNTPEHVSFSVEHVYEDFGAGLMWDNIIVHDNVEGNNWTWQLLYRNQMEIFEYGSKQDQWKLLDELIAKLNRRNS